MTIVVDASVALRGAETQHRVVEHVVSVKAELRPDLFGEVEVLRKRDVGEERTGSAEGITPNIADVTASREGKRPGSRARQRTGVKTSQIRIGEDVRRLAQGRYRSEPEDPAVHRMLADVKRLSGHQIRAAGTRVGNLSAFANRNSKR